MFNRSLNSSCISLVNKQKDSVLHVSARWLMLQHFIWVNSVTGLKSVDSKQPMTLAFLWLPT